MGGVMSNSLVRTVSAAVTSNPLVMAAAEDFTIQWVLCTAAIMMKTEKFYDLAGSSTFIYLTLSTLRRGARCNWSSLLNNVSTRHLVQNTAVTVWATRLGTYLVSRILADGEDKRFRKAKDSNPTMFLYWTIQGVWVWLTLLPTMILNSKGQQAVSQALNSRDYLGWTMWACGFLMQVTADYQKSRFRSNPANKGQFITSGLWSISRHPNYFGEILMWAGLFLPASNTFEGMDWLSMASPVFVAFLLMRVSGIPILERMGDKRWGHLADYQAYKRNTAVLVPWLW